MAPTTMKKWKRCRKILMLTRTLMRPFSINLKLGSLICPQMRRVTVVMSRWVTKKTLTIWMSTIESWALIQRRWSHRIRLNIRERQKMTQFMLLRRRRKQLSRPDSVKDPNCWIEWCKGRVSSLITRSWIALSKSWSLCLQIHRVIKTVQTIPERRIRRESLL